MNTFKRSLAMMLVLCMLFSMAPITAFAEGTADPAGTAVPTADQPAADQPVADQPAAVQPAADQPAADQPAADQPAADQPAADQPAADQPAADQPAANQPAANQPAADQPAADQPAANQPAADQPAADQPAADQPAANQPAANQPAADQPAADQPAANQPAADQPAADQPAANQPAANQPAADQPAADQPVADQPAADQPAAGEAEKDPYGIAPAAEDDIAPTNFEPTTVSLSYADTYRILHLDCGRKYFTVDWIKALINEMAAAGFTHLELAFGNDNLRFLLDDMSVGNYSNEQVTAAIQAGNAAKHGAGELTQSEMTAIITHANSKGIKIIPLLNNPGHMNAIVSAASSLTGSSAGYYDSSSTVDLENIAAVAFVKGLVEKYVAYFDSMGCNEFNFGADEYANDVFSEGSMGFGALVRDSKYQLFVNYVNEMAAMIKGYGMVPIAFNDGIYFNQDTSYNFDTQIAVAFWTSGWTGYQSASASEMESKGHKMINVNGDYYYILGKNDKWTPGETTTHDPTLYTEAGSWTNSGFMSSTVSNPMGGMFCIWCDYPGAESETQIAYNARMILRAMAAEMKGLDGTAVSDKVIPGGFNADGTIAEDCNNETVKDDTSSVEVTGCGLTSVTAVVAEPPAIKGAANVLAWDITPYAGEAKYEGAATVKLPVPADWNTSLVKGFYVENGQAVVVEKSTCADGFCSFEMPHFSVGGVMLLDASTAQYDELIELEVSGTHQLVIKNVNYDGEYTTNPTGIATVVAEYKAGEGTSETPVTSVNEGESYYLKNDAGQYMKADATFTTDIAEATKWTLVASTNGYMIHNGNNQYLFYEDGWILFDGWGDDFKFMNGKLVDYYVATQSLIPVSGGGSVDQSTITFTGLNSGTTYTTVGDTTYKIIVHGTVPITIKYQTANGTVIKTETVNVADNATTYTVSNFTHTDGKYYVVDNTTLNITPATVTEYNVIVTETEEDLTQVASLSIEYWQTNARAEEQRGSNVTTKTVTADAAYSENGIDLSTIIPVTTYKQDSSASDPALVYWRSRLLNRATNEQTGENGDDETLNGIGFTKVRYWNGSWAVYTDVGEWQNITLAEYQLVAYYMNDMDLADEVSVATSDWGKKGNGEFGGTYLGSDNVSLAFQVVYEDGTTYPADTTAASLAAYSYFVDHWGNRGVGTIGINQIGDYQIWKITAETGEHYAEYNGSGPIEVQSFTWDKNEMTVWEDAENPVSQYTIQNPANNPNTNGYYDNLRWNEVNESILIRIYIKAVETEDSLKVVYFDEKFGDTLVEYNVIVPAGFNFNNGIVQAGTKTPATLPEFSGNANRKDATGYGIVNALDKTQNFRTDLTQVPEAVGKYRNELYTYTGSEVSADGMTITHFYTINTETLSPNFVADFGLPLSFPLSQVIGENQENLVESVSVVEKTKYGTLSYNATRKTFTYTPTEILRNIDVLSINIKFTTETEATLTNVGVTPATTVYYGEQFIEPGSGWTSLGTYANVGEQEAEVLGESTYYGYDDAYEDCTGASDGTAMTATAIGSKATFTFTGTGIQVFANASQSTGHVSVMVKNKETGVYANVSMVDTVVNGTVGTETTGGQIGKNLSGLPVVSLVDLTGIPHATYEVTISKIMDENSVFIDGIRVFGTLDESKYTTDTNPYTDDEEDNPDFYEARDLVLKALNIQASESNDYKTMYDQVYAQTVAVGAPAVITNANAEYGTMNHQDLLDNGPKNELYLFKGDKLTMNVSTDRVVQLGLKAPEGEASFTLNGTAKTLSTTVDMFYKVAEKGGSTHTITVENTGDKILSVTLLKICDDPNVSFPALTEANIRAILADAGYTEEPEAPTYTMVELKGTDVLIDGTVFDYTGEAIEPAITVNVNGVQLVEGKDYSVTYTNNVEPGTATVTVRGIATASETLGYTGEVSIDFTINAPAEPEVPEETTKPAKPGQGNKPNQDNKPGQGNNKPSQDNKPGQGNKPGQNNSVKKATLKITFVNLMGKKVSTATIAKTGAANEYGVFSAQEICEQAPARRHAVWFLPAIVPYGTAASIVVPVI